MQTDDRPDIAPPRAPSPRDARQQRLAAELRANLKKRKALSKARATAVGTDDAAKDVVADDTPGQQERGP